MTKHSIDREVGVNKEKFNFGSFRQTKSACCQNPLGAIRFTKFCTNNKNVDGAKTLMITFNKW
jgi:hypothetical protein